MFFKTRSDIIELAIPKITYIRTMLFLAFFYLFFLAPLGSGKFDACLNLLMSFAYGMLSCFFHIYCFPSSFESFVRPHFGTLPYLHSNGFPTTFFDLLLSVFARLIGFFG